MSIRNNGVINLLAVVVSLSGFGGLYGCGGEQKPASKTAATEKGEDESVHTMGGVEDPKAHPEQLIPKEKKRQLTEDQRAEFSKWTDLSLKRGRKTSVLAGTACCFRNAALREITRWRLADTKDPAPWT